MTTAPLRHDHRSLQALDPDRDLFAQGLNYAAVVELLESVRRDLGPTIDVEEFLREPTLRHLRSLVGEGALASRAPAAAPVVEPRRVWCDADLSALLDDAEIRQPIDLDRDLFDQGLTSLSVLRLLGRARARCGVRITLEGFMTRPTMRHLAELAARGPGAVGPPAPAPAAPHPPGAPGSLGVIHGDAEKRAFVGAGHNLRRPAPTAPRVSGRAREAGELEAAHARRRSHRRFAPGAVRRDQVLGWLSCLDAVEVDGALRYLYPSAGSTYAVQVYVEVKPGRVDGLDAGLYYYHPVEHALVRLSGAALPSSAHYPYNQPVHERAAFCLHFVAEHRGIEPVYGPQTAQFVAVEVGAIVQLLMTDQARHALGACVLAGMNDTALRTALELGDSQPAVLAMACGGIERVERAAPPAPRPAPRADGIAIVGLHGRFPGADGLDQYWDNLLARRVTLSPAPAGRWPERSVASLRAGFVDAIHDFDPEFFGIAAGDAPAIDPQERLLLRSVYELLELAGYAGSNLDQLGRDVGVFVGVMWNDARSVADELCARGGSAVHAPLSSIANRISHFFDWDGPSIAVDASCSSALAALCLACDSIRQGSCRAAVVGGVNLLAHPSHVDNLSRFGLLSRGTGSDAFGDEASGWLPGEGAGAVLLRPLAQALADGDHVWGVLRGGTLMSGGRSARYGAPSTERQAALMRRTLEAAGVTAAEVQYLEAAAAGSAIGDASEIQAIQRVFLPRTSPLWVGSVKPNIGHLESASGMSQLAKVLLQLAHRRIAPMVPRRGCNPLIQLDGVPIEIVSEAREWAETDGAPRRALINSFGGTGAYASVVIEGPRQDAGEPAADEPAPSVFALSAETRDQLVRQAQVWLALIRRGTLQRDRISLRRIAATLLFGRGRFAVRLAIVATALDDLIPALEAFVRGEPHDALFSGLAGNGVGDAAARSAPRTLRDAARAWVDGGWDAWDPLVPRRAVKVPLPTYPFRDRTYAPSWAPSPAVPPGEPREARAAAAPEPAVPAVSATRAAVEAAIRRSLAVELGPRAMTIDPDTRILELGVPSMGMVRIVAALERDLHATLPVELLLRFDTIAELALHLAPGAGEPAVAAPATAPRGRSLPAPAGEAALSEGQTGLWALQRLRPDMTAYNCPVCWRVSGRLDRAIVEQACQALVRQYPILTAAIVDHDGAPRMTLDAARRVSVIEDDICSLAEAEVLDQLRARVRTPFRLDQGPLVRVHILRRGPGDGYLLFTIHHIVFDGGSLRPLGETFHRLYRELVRGERPAIRPLDASFDRFLAAERELVDGPDGARRLAYWRTELDGELPSLCLHREPRPLAPGTAPRGACIERLSGPLGAAIRGLARDQRAYVSTVFLAAFKALLFRYTGQRDAIVGIPVDMRGTGDGEQIGFFVNMVPIRSSTAADQTFASLVAAVQASALRGFAHSYPFADLIRRLGIVAAGRSPVFQAAFAYQGTIGEAPAEAADPGAPRLEPVEDVFQDGEYEVELDVYERGDGFVLRLTYDLAHYDPALMARMVEHYLGLLEAVVRDPARPLGDHALVSDADRARLRTWNATRVDYPGDRLVHRLFEAQVRERPDAVAVVFEAEQLTYRQLDARANQLAHYLRRHGVGPDTLVGVCMERSAELVVALMGILKAGGAYVPIDPDHPARRIEFVVSDIHAPVLLVQREFQSKIRGDGAAVLCLRSQWQQVGAEPSSPPAVDVEPHHLAYVIYTSGSTGNPKGCMLPHAAVCNRLRWMQDCYRMTERDRVLQKTPYSFDVSVWELFWPLMCGAPLVLAAPRRHTDPRYLIELIEAQQITICHFVPSMLRAFVQALRPGRCGSLRQIFASGEALPYALFEDVTAALGAELHNLYGPTEAAVDVTFWRTRANPERRIPIGQPIANCQIHILDANLQLLPIGVPGELHIGGAGLARGYLGRPDLTEAKFIANPFDDADGPRLYRTGDLARWLPDGTIEYLGRLDHQVKIRGFRIELGEIEACLLGHPRVRECAVLAEDDGAGDRRLVAYLVFRDGPPPTVGELREFVGAALPEYMVPAKFVGLTQLPLTSSGKIDRAAIARFERAIEAPRERVAPRTATEIALHRLWKELLGADAIGVHDSFFELGGHSLKVALMVSRIERELPGAAVDQVAFYKRPTIEGLAELLTAGDRPRELVPQLLASQRPAELSVICCPYAGAQPIVYHPLAAELARRSDRLALYAVAPPEHGPETIEQLAAACVERILETVTGPIALYGHCTGVYLALEITRQLEQRGRSVEALFVAAATPFHWGARLVPVSDLWRLVSDERIHRMMKSWGAPKDAIDPATLAELIRRFRRDARMAFHYGKRPPTGKLAAPIVNVVSADDSLTRGFQHHYHRWERHADTVRLIVLDRGEHYFVGKLADVVADIIVRVHNDPDAMVERAQPVREWPGHAHAGGRLG
jgi:amino acid adenylation domain-containing protein